MAQSAEEKAKLKAKKKFFNMAYNIGASVVIIGALFKILHLEVNLGGVKIGGGLVLGIGLVCEALIFFISAFEPVEEGYDWAIVYPELAGDEPIERTSSKNDEHLQHQLIQQQQAQQLAFEQQQAELIRLQQEAESQIKDTITNRLDKVFNDAKLDANLVSSLSKGIENFTTYSKQLEPVMESMNSISRYTEELSVAATHLESLNSLYRLQLERTEYQVSAQSGIVDNMNMLNEEFVSFKDNLAALNKVYGGMLSAMK